MPRLYYLDQERHARDLNFNNDEDEQILALDCAVRPERRLVGMTAASVLDPSRSQFSLPSQPRKGDRMLETGLACMCGRPLGCKSFVENF